MILQLIYLICVLIIFNFSHGLFFNKVVYQNERENNNNNDNDDKINIIDQDDDDDGDDNFSSSSEEKEMADNNDDDNEYQKDGFFHKCPPNQNLLDCRPINFPIHDKTTHAPLLIPVPKKNAYNYHILPNSHLIPYNAANGGLGYCGFGKLLYDTQELEWSCHCLAPDYLGGEMCDEPQPKMIRENKCLKIGQSTNIVNTNISSFNPFIDGVCVKCVSPESQVPIVNEGPVCEEIHSDKNDNDDDDDDNNNQIRKYHEIIAEWKKNPCKFDALNPQLYNSPNNFFDPQYGCICDYHNGFVEAIIEGHPLASEHQVSHVCVKIGRDNPMGSHRTDVAYYTFQNNLHPVQVHSFTNLEYPFDIIFKNTKELLVKQLTATLSNTFDWLNRHIKPTSSQNIRRIDYPNCKWPVVNKKSLVNYYATRGETFPISAFRLATGRGFETKHWYETTRDRYISNAVIGHPIVYTFHKDTPWTGKVTLNPLGAKYIKYYGATLLTKPGEVVRLDTRGYESRRDVSENRVVITIPPDYQTEMMDESDIIYVGALYISYTVDK